MPASGSVAAISSHGVRERMRIERILLVAS
jgi:hypothetical protein